MKRSRALAAAAVLLCLSLVVYRRTAGRSFAAKEGSPPASVTAPIATAKETRAPGTASPPPDAQCRELETELAARFHARESTSQTGLLEVELRDLEALPHLLERIEALKGCAPPISELIPGWRGRDCEDLCTAAELSRGVEELRTAQIRGRQGDGQGLPLGPGPEVDPLQDPFAFEAWARLQGCLTDIVSYRLRLRARALSDKPAEAIERFDDALALVVSGFLDSERPDVRGLLPYAKRMTELKPDSHAAWKFALQLAYANYSMTTDWAERAAMGRELRAMAESAEPFVLGFGNLDPGIRATLARLNSPQEGLGYFARHAPMLETEDRAYFLAWDAADRGNPTQALAWLSDLENSIYRDYGTLARIASHRLRHAKSDGPAFLDPSTMLSINIIATPAQGGATTFSVGTDVGPASFAEARKLDDVPDTVREGFSAGVVDDGPDAWMQRRRNLTRKLAAEGVPGDL